MLKDGTHPLAILLASSALTEVTALMETYTQLPLITTVKTDGTPTK